MPSGGLDNVLRGIVPNLVSDAVGSGLLQGTQGHSLFYRDILKHVTRDQGI